MAQYFNMGGGGGGGDSALAWINNILGWINRSVDTNREAQDRTALSDWAKGGFQGPMPDVSSERYKTARDQWLGEQLAATQRNQDVQALTKWNNWNQQAQGAMDWLSGNQEQWGVPSTLQQPGSAVGSAPLPMLTSPDLGKQMQDAFALSRMQPFMPLNPVEEAQRQNYLANALESTTRAQVLATPQPKEYEPVLLFNPKTQEQAAWAPGTAIPPGGPWQKVGSGPSTVVNVGAEGKITQPTRTKIEDQILMDSNFARSLQNLSGEFKPEYFELAPVVKSWLYNNLTGKVKSLRDAVPNQDQQFYADTEAFRSQANQVFNEYRKVITGAQAGMPEIMFLRRSVPTTSDSPAVFEAKAQVAQAFFERRADIYQQALESDAPLRTLLSARQLDQQAAKEIADRVKSGEFGPDIQKALGVSNAAPGGASQPAMTTEQKIARLRQLGAPEDKIQAALTAASQPNTESQAQVAPSEPMTTTPPAGSQYRLGQVVPIAGKNYKVVGWAQDDGEPMLDEVK